MLEGESVSLGDSSCLVSKQKPSASSLASPVFFPAGGEMTTCALLRFSFFIKPATRRTPGSFVIDILRGKSADERPTRRVPSLIYIPLLAKLLI